ncbi:MAG: ribonuclease H-like domain-containing protein [Oligoflexales bacterium]
MWIQQTFRHCEGIGPRYEHLLHSQGITHWDQKNDLWSTSLGINLKQSIPLEIQKSTEAMLHEDIQYFIDKLPPCHHWRVMKDFWDDICWIDIETTGLSPHKDHITIATTLYKGEMQHFIRKENLKELPQFLSGIKVFASFGGSHFDIPRIIEEFRLGFWKPPHLDLRWIAYHQGYTGGLKNIENSLGIPRPTGLQHTNGAEAVQLWHQHKYGSRSALKKLIAYSKADVDSLPIIAEKILNQYISTHASIKS